MLSMILKVPLAVIYAIAILTMIVCSVPFIVAGFATGFIKWAWQIGNRLSDRAFLHFT